MSYDRQCPSCGGFCGRGGCKRENVKPEPMADSDLYAVWLNGFHSRKPLTDEEVDKIIAEHVTITDQHLLAAVYMAIREVEQAHGIGGE